MVSNEPGGRAGGALAATVALARERAAGRTPIVGIAGPQGSGKTTLVKAFAAADPTVAAFSLDDVYLPASYRRLIADAVHPLFRTRGPPGTHNLMQFEDTLDALISADDTTETRLPGFDKVADDPLPPDLRPVFRGRPSVILVDGWCLGATPQPEEALAAPVNALERQVDADGVWRREVNANLAGAYQDAFARLDAVLYLKPPSFDVVAGWREEQEAGLLGRALTEADKLRVRLFVQHFERITRWMLAGGVRADVTVQLDARRGVVA
jgi:D-glycerate 3-kinase